jgi:hypothetical protein
MALSGEISSHAEGGALAVMAMPLRSQRSAISSNSTVVSAWSRRA